MHSVNRYYPFGASALYQGNSEATMMTVHGPSTHHLGTNQLGSQYCRSRDQLPTEKPVGLGWVSLGSDSSFTLYAT